MEKVRKTQKRQINPNTGKVHSNNNRKTTKSRKRRTVYAGGSFSEGNPIFFPKRKKFKGYMRKTG